MAVEIISRSISTKGRTRPGSNSRLLDCSQTPTALRGPVLKVVKVTNRQAFRICPPLFVAFIRGMHTLHGSNVIGPVKQKRVSKNCDYFPICFG